MAEKQDKSKKSRSRMSKKSKWIISGSLLVGAVMLLSSLWAYDLSREMPQDQSAADTTSWKLIQYDSATIGGQSAITQIVSSSGDYKLRPNQMSRLTGQDLAPIFESNISGVTSIALETAPGDEMFQVSTDGRNVTDEIRKRIRIPGGYTIYRVYQGSTPYGLIDVVGDGLKTGDFARVILMERKRGKTTEVLGFVQKRIHEGDKVDARVVDLGGAGFTGRSERDVSSGIADALDNPISFVRSEESAPGYSVVVFAPRTSDAGAVEAALRSLNVTGLRAGRLAYTEVPDEMLVSGAYLAVPASGRFPTLVFRNVSVNDTIGIRVASDVRGNSTAGTALYAIEA